MKVAERMTAQEWFDGLALTPAELLEDIGLSLDATDDDVADLASLMVVEAELNPDYPIIFTDG